MVIKCSGLQWDINCNAMQNVWTGILWEQYLKTGIHWVWNIIRCRTAGITICNLVDSHFTYSTITIRPSDQLSVKNAKGHARSNTKKLLNSKKSRQLTELSSLTTNGSDESSTALPHFVVKDDGQLNSKREEKAPRISSSSLILGHHILYVTYSQGWSIWNYVQPEMLDRRSIAASSCDSHHHRSQSPPNSIQAFLLRIAESMRNRNGTSNRVFKMGSMQLRPPLSKVLRYRYNIAICPTM